MSESIVVLCMGGVGHLQALLPLVGGLCDRGWPVYVLTEAAFRTRVEALGAGFVDLFAGRSLDAADAESIPIPSRYVTFAGVYAESLCEEVRRLSPALVIYDSFAVAGPLIARRLGRPYVAVSSGHALVPARALADLSRDPRVATSSACLAAVERLRGEYGMSGAHRFSYVDSLSPFLNLYCEPAEFLPEEDRAAFEPLAFFGSLAPPSAREPDSTADRSDARLPRVGRRARRRIYVCFGTVVWWYFEAAACAALDAICRTLAERDIEVEISLGGHDLRPQARARLARANVRVVDYADQWKALAQADAFVTHHGVNSTHEAIFQRVPMLSYPFFGDQPALAHRCQELGLAQPLADAPQAPIAPERLLAALERIESTREHLTARLAEARSWELRTIADRPAVLDRLLALAVSGRRA